MGNLNSTEPSNPKPQTEPTNPPPITLKSASSCSLLPPGDYLSMKLLKAEIWEGPKLLPFTLHPPSISHPESLILLQYLLDLFPLHYLPLL